MKRMQDIDFSKTFGTPPPSFEQRVQYTLRRTEKEEQAVKKMSLRFIFVTVLIIAVMTTAAVAAGQLANWSDYFRQYTQIGIPQAAVDEMKKTESLSWQIGPLTFSVQELLTDGHIAMSSTTIRVSDGGQALICSEYQHDQPFFMSGQFGRNFARQLGLDENMTWIQAAQQLSLPLYSARAMIEAPFEYSSSARTDVLWNDDYSISFFCMADLDKAMPKDTLPVTFHLRANLIDLSAGEPAQTWTDYEQRITLPVSPLLEEKTYTAANDAHFMGFTFERLEAKQYITGAYVDIIFTAQDGVSRDTARELYNLNLTDMDGNSLPHGIDRTLSMDRSEWPQVTVKMMVGTDTLPESIMITDGKTILTIH